MNRIRGWTLAVGAALLLGLAACGGGSSSGDGQVRVVNATRSHAAIDLNSSSTKVISAVGVSTVSGYVGIGAGSASLQLADAGSQTVLVSSGPTITKDQNYTLLAYESSGAIRTAWLSENDTAPTSGTANLRVFDVASDAGALDVYITAAGVDLTGATPSFTLANSSGVQSTATLALTPGTYRVRITAAGSPADLRLDMPSVSLADQQFVNLILTPTIGGGLVDGATLVEKGAYASTVNGNARVRVVSGLAGGLVVASTANGVVEAGAVSPTIGSYVTLPAGSAAWTVTANGSVVAVPPLTLTAGSDNTVLISGTAAAAQVALLVDDNHSPTLASTDTMRIVNGLSGSNAGLSLSVDFSLLANNVTPGTASGYKTIAANTNLRLEVDSPLSVTPVSLQTGLNVLGGGVFSVFVLGDAGAPVTVLRRDR